MLMPEFHPEWFRFSWYGVLARLWNFLNVLRWMKCTAGLRTTILDDCIRILGKTRVCVILKNNILNYSFYTFIPFVPFIPLIPYLFVISSNRKWGCEGFFIIIIIKRGPLLERLSLRLRGKRELKIRLFILCIDKTSHPQSHQHRWNHWTFFIIVAQNASVSCFHNVKFCFSLLQLWETSI